MMEQRLTELVLLLIHCTENINIDQVLNGLDASGHRRITLVVADGGLADASDDEWVPIG